MKHLRDLYDTAFRDWTVETRRLHELRAHAGKAVDVDGAEIRATAAHSAYREVRDRLAQAVAAEATGKAACA